MERRNVYIDTAGGILLVHMIAYHCWQWANLSPDAFWLKPLAFFMPWFFFKAGQFYHSRPIKRTISTSWHRLMKPYIVYTIIGTAVLWIKQFKDGTFNGLNTVLISVASIVKFGSAPGNLALWFLFSLFVIRVIFTIIEERFPSTIQWLTVSLPILYHLFTEHFDIELPLYFSNILSGLAFYTLGFKFKDFRPPLILIICLFLIYISSALLFPQIVDMRSGIVISGCFIGWMMLSLIGIITLNGICAICFNFANLFSWIGSNTMPFYCWHWVILVAISIFTSPTNFRETQYFIIEISTLTIVLPSLYYLQLKIEKLIHRV